MNETPSNSSKRTWGRPVKLFAWFIILFAASFLCVFCIALLTDKNARTMDLLPLTLGLSLLLALLAGCGLLLVRSLCSWRNLRRFLFVLACLVTLIALAYAEENWRGKHAWQKHRHEWEAKGEKFDIAALVPPAVPDDQNFARASVFMPALDFTQGPSGAVWRDTNALAHLEGISAILSSPESAQRNLALGSLEKGTFADLAACEDFYRDNTNYPQAAASATSAEVVLVALGKFNPELEELRKAAATRPYTRFPIHYDYEPCWGILLPHLARLKGLTMLVHVRATAELEAGRSAEAFEDLKLGFRLSDAMHDEPLLIDHLVRVATLAINLQTVREGLLRHAWTDPQLAQLETNLASINLLTEYKLSMEGERAFSTAGLDYLRRLGLRANPMLYLGNDDGFSRTAGGFGVMPSGWFYQNMLTISRLHQDLVLPAVDEKAHRVFPELSENAARAVEKLPTGPYTIFAKMLLPALQKVVRKSARMQTLTDAGRTACALERYRLANGKLPENLDVLLPHFIDSVPHDVIDGKPLRYQLKPDGTYLLYSVGWNETDDGGQIAWNRKKKDANVDLTQGDWVWKLAAK